MTKITLSILSKTEALCHISLGSVGVPLVEAKICPADNKAARILGRVRSFDEANQVQYERHGKHAERDVAVRNFANG